MYVDGNREVIKSLIQNIKSKILTLLPHRRKRGLVNSGGKLLNWLYGTMDNDDRTDIEQHFKITDENNHRIIQNMNQQIKINNNFNKTFELIKSTIENDRLKINNKLNEITKNEVKLFNKQLILELIFKLNLILSHVQHLQDNVASARTNILHPNILTDDEIITYNIDLNKLLNIILELAKHIDNSIIFAIKIPSETIKTSKKLIVPMVDTNKFEINENMEFFIDLNNKHYIYEENKNLKELKLSKN